MLRLRAHQIAVTYPLTSMLLWLDFSSVSAPHFGGCSNSS